MYRLHGSSGAQTPLQTVPIVGANGTNAAGSVTIPHLAMDTTSTWDLYAEYVNTATGYVSSQVLVATTSVHSAPAAGSGTAMPSPKPTPTPTVTSGPTEIGYYSAQTTFVTQFGFTLPASQTPPGGSASGTATWAKQVQLLRAVTGSGNWESAGLQGCDPSGTYVGNWSTPKGSRFDFALRILDGNGGTSNVSAIIYTNPNTRHTLGQSNEGWPSGTTFSASATTLDPAHTYSALTLSANGLSISSTTAGWSPSRALLPITAGRVYAEITLNNITSDFAMIGIANASAAIASGHYPGSDANGWGYISSTGQLYHSASPAAYGASYANGDVIGIALDLVAGTLTFYKNGVSQGTAVSAGLTGGTWYLMVGLYGGTGTAQLTVNFGGSAFAQPVPSGFSPYAVAYNGTGGGAINATIPVSLAIGLPSSWTTPGGTLAQALNEVLVLAKLAGSGDTAGGSDTTLADWSIVNTYQTGALPSTIQAPALGAGQAWDIAVAFVDFNNQFGGTTIYPILTTTAQLLVPGTLPGPASAPSVALSANSVAAGISGSTAYSALATFTAAITPDPTKWLDYAEVVYAPVGASASLKDTFVRAARIAATSWTGTGAVTFTSLSCGGLPAGSAWDLRLRLVDHQGVTYDGGKIGTTTAVGISNAAQPTMPAGATFTLTGVTSGIGDFGYVGAGGLGGTPTYDDPQIAVSGTISESNSPPMSTWSGKPIWGIRVHSTSNTTVASTYQWTATHPVEAIGNGSVIGAAIAASPGDSYDVAVQIPDRAGNLCPSAATCVQVLSNVAVPVVASGGRFGAIVTDAMVAGGAAIKATKLVYTGGATVDSLKPAEAGAQVFTGKSITLLTGLVLDNLSDGTYAKPLATALTSGQVDLSKAGVIGKTGANITYTSGGGTLDSLKPAAVGADVTSANTANDTAHVNGTAAATVSQGAARANAVINASDQIAAASSLFAGGSTVESLSSSTAAIAGQGNVIPSAGITTVPSYTSTSSSITISVPAYTFTRSDGGTWSTPSTSPSPFTGLSASTTYHFNIWYVIATNTVVVTKYSTSALTPAQRAAAVADGLVPIYIDFPATTPASGSGSGGGGAGGGGGVQCPATHQQIETLERGFVRADELQIGERLRDPWQGWNVIEKLMVRPTVIYRITTDEESVDVNDTHAVLSAQGDWRVVTDLRPGVELMPIPGEPPPVVRAVERIGEGEYVAIQCERHRYVLGRHLAHNITF